MAQSMISSVPAAPSRARSPRFCRRSAGLDAATQPLPSCLESPPNRDVLGRSGHAGRLRAGTTAAQARRSSPRRLRAALGVGGRRAPGRSRRPTATSISSWIDRRVLPRQLSRAGPTGARWAPGGKAIVEHTAINPNKAAHIGHLRNSALGDTLVRVLRFRGIPVEVQNYIDDTGVQVADVVVGFRVLEGKTLDEIRADRRFHALRLLLLGPLRARHRVVRARTRSGSPSARQTLHDIEHGGNDNAAIAAFIADRIVRCHLKTMARMNVDYDLLTWEGDILRLKFWAQAFDVLKAKGAVCLRTEGRLAGCWVMPIQEDLEANPEARIPNPNPTTGSGSRIAERRATPKEREKVIVRSNGVVTYVGKDIAYQFWKLGLLGQRLPLSSLRSRERTVRCGRRARPAANAAIRCSAARRTSTTSSTCGSRICRSC